MTEEQQFTALLSSELTCLQNLLDTLNQEYEALASADIDALENATQQKNNDLVKQTEATIARQNFVTTIAGESSEEIRLQQLITKYQGHDNLSTTLNQLHSLAEQCQTMNRTNGRLISQKQKQTRNALDILRQADSKPSTYSDQGGTVSSAENRILGKA